MRKRAFLDLSKVPTGRNQPTPALRDLGQGAYRGSRSIASLTCPVSQRSVQNLRDPMAMDIDEEDVDGTQRARETKDYGIEVDFEELDDDDREVRCRCGHWINTLISYSTEWNPTNGSGT